MIGILLAEGKVRCHKGLWITLHHFANMAVIFQSSGGRDEPPNRDEFMLKML